MKKTLVFLAAIAIVCAFSACDKEGVYHPKKKISKIYEQPGGSSKELVEKWTWDGKNVVKISSADGLYYRKFTYEKDRIKRITSSNGAYSSFTFDGKYIKKIEHRSAAEELLATYSFKHTKDKITTVTYEEYDYSGDEYKKDLASTLSLFLPVQAVESIVNQKRPASLTKGETFISTVEYKWDGDNIKTATLTYGYEEEIYGNTYSYSYKQEINYTYDKKTNPFYNFFDVVNSKNNIILAEVLVVESYGTTTESDAYTVEYDITYDGKWPEEILETYRNGSSVELLTTTYVYED